VDIPFETGKGAKLGNIPDGRYGIFWQRKDEESFLQTVIYEYYNTLAGDYLRHPIYTGWVHQQQVLAAPFFEYDSKKNQITNNRFTSHHLGIGGTYSSYYNSYPFKILLTWQSSRGISGIAQLENKFSAYYTSRLYTNAFNLDLQLGSDFSNLHSPNFAAGISLTWSLESR
jgi:hypothetical protein